MLNYQRVCDIHGSQNSSEATSNHSFALPGTHTDSKLSKAHLKERTWRGGKNCVIAPTQGLLQASLFQGTVVAQPFPRPVDSSQAGACAFCRPAFFKARWTFAGRSLGPSAGQPFLRYLFDPAARSSQPQMETILNLLQSWKANPVPTEFACKMLYRLELVESDSAVIIRIILQLFPCYLWLPPMISCYSTVMFHSCWLF